MAKKEILVAGRSLPHLLRRPIRAEEIDPAVYVWLRNYDVPAGLAVNLEQHRRLKLLAEHFGIIACDGWTLMLSLRLMHEFVGLPGRPRKDGQAAARSLPKDISALEAEHLGVAEVYELFSLASSRGINLDDEAWSVKLALSLAEQFVPGLRTAEGARVGRPRVRGDHALALNARQEIWDVTVKGLSVNAACKLLAKKPKWRDLGAGWLRKQYYALEALEPGRTAALAHYLDTLAATGGVSGYLEKVWARGNLASSDPQEK